MFWSKLFNNLTSFCFQIESITTEFQGTEAPKLLWTSFCDCTAGSLSTLELEDVMIDGNGEISIL